MSFLEVLGWFALITLSLCATLGLVFALTDRLRRKSVPPKANGGNPYNQFLPKEVIEKISRK
ncbi:hypothetical protein [Paenibacillus sp. MMO-177]|uniref:hypothetical protein n=1 Tax=Paenibacillus sp. MMO-177 TaxID=3081289 RepID=UPI003016EF10